MRRALTRVVLTCLLLCTLASAQKKIKVIADQDSAGPQGTNFLSLLMLLRAPQIDLLGITTVSGDQWMEPATVFALWGWNRRAPRCSRYQGRGNAADQYAPRAGAPRSALRFLRRLARIIQPRRSAKQTWAPPGGYPKLKPRPGALPISLPTPFAPIPAKSCSTRRPLD